MRDERRLVLAGYALLLLAALAVPWIFGAYRVGEFTLVVVYAVAVLGLNLLVGYAGQISLGHGAFFALGAYTTAILVESVGFPHLAALPCAGAACFAAGLLLGLPALRIRGLYLALVTLAVAIAAPQLIKRLDALTGGTQGMSVTPPAAPDWLPLAADQFLYLLALAVAVPMFFLAANLVRGRQGRAMAAMRENEVAAKAMGVDLTTTKLASFAVGCTYAGVAGGLYVFSIGYVAPESFTLAISFAFLAAIVVGGLGTIAGAVFGALFIEFVPVYAADVNQALAGVIYGALLIAFMYVLRDGVVGGLRRATQRLRQGEEVVVRRARTVAWMVMVTGLALASWGCGRDEGGGDSGQSPGITDTQITLGGSYPFSGPASAYRVIADGAKAYFAEVNEDGGVDGRKIKFVTLDDAYEPARAAQNARRLIQQEDVFALFNTLGTANNLAIWDYVNDQKVPHLFLASGSPAWGDDVEGHPYTVGLQPDYATEARIYAEYLRKARPRARVAVLYQNDDYGKSLLDAFEAAVAGSGLKVVAKESYEATDPTVASQMRKLASSGADTFLDISTPKFAAQAIVAIAKSGWKPLHILNSVSASKAAVLEPAGLERSKGIVSAIYYKYPDDPQWADDAAMKEYKAALEEHSPRANPNDPDHAYGWLAAAAMVEALERMEEPTRASLMDAVRKLDVEVPMLLPGIKVETGAGDGYPIESMQIAEFDGNVWKLQGEVLHASR